MKQSKFIIPIVILILVGLVKISGSDNGNNHGIIVALSDAKGGITTYLSAQPLAHSSGSLENRHKGILISAVDFDYSVDKDVKFIEAHYIIHLHFLDPDAKGGFKGAINCYQRLPISSSKTDIALGTGEYNAYALLTK